MAEATGLRNNALPYPIYGAPFGVVYPMLDADGDLVTGATTPDAEVSKNGDTFADCTNESTEIATASGIYYLLLTATEMTADVVAVIAKSATAGMKTTPLVLYPRKLVTVRSGTSASAGSATNTIVLDGSASAIDDFYNGMVCIATIDSNVEVRVISDYVGSTQTASVVPDWNVAPDNNDTFVIKLPEGVQVIQANTTHISGTVQTANDVGADVNEILTDTGTTLQGELDGIQADTEDIQSRLPAALTAGGNIKADALAVSGDATAADTLELFAEALDQSTGQLDSGSLAANTITAASIAADAITDAKVAADVTIASVTGAVGSVTGNVGGNVTGSVGSLAAQAKADVNAEVDAALVDVRLDELIAADSDIDGAAPPTVGSVFHELMTKTAGSFTYDQSTDSLEAVRDNMGTAQTGDSFARLGAPAGASVSADIAAIEAQTDDIGVAGAGLTAIPWNAAWDAEVQSEVQDAVEVNHLDHLLAVTYDPASKPGAADALLNELVESDSGVARYTANALEQGPGGGSAPTAAEVADAVWEEAIADHSGTVGSTAEALSAAGSAGDPWITALPGSYGAGSAGKILGDNLNATVSSRATQTSVDTIDDLLDTEVAAIKSDTAAILIDTAEIGTAGAGLTNINLPDQAMNITGNITGNLSGSVGSVTAGVSLADDAITAAKYDEATAFPVTASDSGATQIARVGADSDTLETLSDQLDAKASQASVDDVPTNAELATALGTADDAVLAAVAALNNLSAADVRTAIGLAAANLDTQLSTIDTNVDSVLADTGTDGVVVAAGSKTGYTLSATGIDGILDEAIGDSTVTMRQALKALLAASAGKLSGAATTTVTIRNVADDTDVIVATVDEDGNRSAVTLTL